MGDFYSNVPQTKYHGGDNMCPKSNTMVETKYLLQQCGQIKYHGEDQVLFTAMWPKSNTMVETKYFLFGVLLESLLNQLMKYPS